MTVLVLIERVLKFSDDHPWFNWTVGHSVLPLIFVFLGSLVGHPISGAVVGFVLYVDREIEHSIWPRYKATGRITIKTDNWGDIAAPTVILVATVLGSLY